MLKRRELAGPLTQRRLESGDATKRLVDDHQVEELVACTRRLTALTQTVLKSGSGCTHNECTEVRLPYPKSAPAVLPGGALQCRGIHAAAPGRLCVVL